MRYVAAYLLATLGGKANPSKDDIIKILESVGLDVDDENLSKVRLCSERGWQLEVVGITQCCIQKMWLGLAN